MSYPLKYSTGTTGTTNRAVSRGVALVGDELTSRGIKPKYEIGRGMSYTEKGIKKNIADVEFTCFTDLSDSNRTKRLLSRAKKIGGYKF